MTTTSGASANAPVIYLSTSGRNMNNRPQFHIVFWIPLSIVSEIGAILLAVTLLRINFSPLMAVIGGLVGGAMVGLAQWFALRTALAIGPSWIFASMVGWSLGWIVFGFEFTADQVDLLALTVIGPMMGAGIVPIQWILLRQVLDRSSRWIPVMLIGRLLGTGAGIAVALGTYGLLETTASLQALVLSYMSFGLLASAGAMSLITGIGALWILHKVRVRSAKPDNQGSA